VREAREGIKWRFWERGKRPGSKMWWWVSHASEAMGLGGWAFIGVMLCFVLGIMGW